MKKQFSECVSSPWMFIPAVYLIAGAVESGILQYGVTIMYKDLGYSNAFIGYLSFLQIPILISFLFAPYVDRLGSKRMLTIVFMFLMAIVSAVIPLTLSFQFWFTASSLAALLMLSISFALFKIVSEGYYIRALTPQLQAGFIGIKTAAIRLGIILTVAFLVGMAGRINVAEQTTVLGWQRMFVVLTCVIFAAGVYNLFFLPKPASDEPVLNTDTFALWAVFKEYLKQRRAILIILFIILYRFGEGLLLRMADPFFMDPVDQGGLAMDIPSLVTIKSFVAIPCTIAGGIAGGWLVKKFGLIKTFLPLSLCMSLPNLGYWWIAKTQSLDVVHFTGMLLNRDAMIVVSIESLGYGIGFSAFFYYLHAVAVGKNKTSLFAISTALMALGIYLPSTISGIVQEAVGYQTLFLLSFICALPGVFLIRFIPLNLNGRQL